MAANVGKQAVLTFVSKLDGGSAPPDSKRLKRDEAKEKLKGQAEHSAKEWIEHHDKARVYEAKIKGEDVFVIVHPKPTVGRVVTGDVEAFDKQGKLLVKLKSAVIKDGTDQFDE